MLDTFWGIGAVGNEWITDTKFFRIVEKGYNLQFL